MQIIHLTGVRDERLVADNYLRENIPAYVAPFHHRMEEAYSAADLALARSGAASLAELAFYGLPSILIPFPYAADDHQTRNAEIVVAAGAAILLKESELSGDLLTRSITALAGDTTKLRRMSESSTAIAPQHAADLVASTMEKYSNDNGAA